MEPSLTVPASSYICGRLGLTITLRLILSVRVCEVVKSTRHLQMIMERVCNRYTETHSQSRMIYSEWCIYDSGPEQQNK